MPLVQDSAFKLTDSTDVDDDVDAGVVDEVVDVFVVEDNVTGSIKLSSVSPTA